MYMYVCDSKQVSGFYIIIPHTVDIKFNIDCLLSEALYVPTCTCVLLYFIMYGLWVSYLTFQAVQSGTVVFVDNLKKNKKLW